MATAVAVPGLVMQVDEIVWFVALPIVASWFGLVGLAFFEQRPLAQVFSQLAGAVFLGGVVGIVAMAVIATMALRGEVAAFFTLSIAMAPAVIGKMIGKVGPKLLSSAVDSIAGSMGFERKKKDEGDE
ncbi:hypothetical protein [Croceicoccus sp. YJ47]|uniref:hypothetical protein n=1 Tax=Croceicoccus sp. YJ47 TaxID=2798724 RepID=UPI001920F610|nr:hypothetical protein [Croceicoccus sp. YJ47]QQN75047.1 hypothetical protein JD971_04945 [Croceicoccus sp. YJ47]